LKVLASKVTYAPQTIPRTEWDNHGPYFYKDTKFMDEREFRLITHPPEDHAIGEEDVAQKLPIGPAALIEQIVIHPRSSIEFKNRIKDFLQTKEIRISVSKSALACA